MAKKKKSRAPKKSLKHHAQRLHAVGKKYIAHTLKTASMHSNKKRKMQIKKALTEMEKALKQLTKMELR